uniref:glycosyltransferase n=1 Tax=Mediterraneibacter glycyrrhizinilyticus TaxID=342942 RepID=UPI000AB906AC
MTEIQKKKMLLGFIMDGTSGGVDNYILHFLDAVKEEGLQIDLLTNEADPELKERLLREYGSHLYEIANLHHPVRQFQQVRELIRREQYGMVYLNISTSMDCIAALAAWSMHVPRRMLHSHSGGNDCESAAKRAVFDTLQKICRTFLYRAGTEFYACSKKAGYWMYPKKVVESGKFHVICNAVDQRRFSYHPEIREEIRKELGIEDAFAIGHAGNFCYQKIMSF